MATVTIDGSTYEQVGIKLKGNSSLFRGDAGVGGIGGPGVGGGGDIGQGPEGGAPGAVAPGEQPNTTDGSAVVPRGDGAAGGPWWIEANAALAQKL